MLVRMWATGNLVYCWERKLKIMLEHSWHFLLKLIIRVSYNEQLCSWVMTHRKEDSCPLKDGFKNVLNVTIQKMSKTDNTPTFHIGKKWNKKILEYSSDEILPSNENEGITTIHNNICETQVMLDKTSWIEQSPWCMIPFTCISKPADKCLILSYKAGDGKGTEGLGFRSHSLSCWLHMCTLRENPLSTAFTAYALLYV